MKRSVLNKWIKDLRENGDLQGAGALHRKAAYDKERFCCLGRFCVIIGLKPDEISRDDGDGKLFSYNGEPATLPKTIIDEHGFVDAAGSVKYKYEADAAEMTGHLSLTAMNDHDRSFAQIADALEQHPEWFFTNIEEDV